MPHVSASLGLARRTQNVACAYRRTQTLTGSGPQHGDCRLIDVQGTFVENDRTRSTRGSLLRRSASWLSWWQCSNTVGDGRFGHAADNRRNCDFSISFKFVPKVSIYEVLFTGSDCTTAPCTALSSTTAFNFSVCRNCGRIIGATWRFLGPVCDGPDFPEDTINVAQQNSVDLGYMLIHTIDAGGNPVTTRDLINHTITSSLVTTELVLVSSISTFPGGPRQNNRKHLRK